MKDKPLPFSLSVSPSHVIYPEDREERGQRKRAGESLVKTQVGSERIGLRTGKFEREEERRKK
jgi:hypothetical protein